ncbi:MAG: TlpA family protein disulfide reductase [Chloroflexi bacterium]|nr:TlpA family protein disulfide reductase [Chloroflexota bacterium]
MITVIQRVRNGIWFAPVLVVALVIACAGRPASPAESTPTSAPAKERPAAEAIASRLPADFQIDAYKGGEILRGEKVLLSSVLAQGKPVVLNFFAGLCPPCRAEMPDLQKVFEKLGSQFILVSVDVGPFTGLGSNADGLALVNDLGITFPTGSTGDGQVVRKYKVLGMPSTSFIKPDGTVIRKWDGALNQAKMEELVGQLVAASQGS